jgi:ATP-dependent 26S proteasome regulatory subunit
MLIRNPKVKTEYGFYEKPESPEEFKTLPNGRYSLNIYEGLMGTKILFNKKENLETIVEPTNSEEYKKIRKSISYFFNPKLIELYSDLAYLNKKGILIHGKPGTGKTASVSYLAEKFAKENDAIILEVNHRSAFTYLPKVIDDLRKDADDKHKPIMCIIDECENYFIDSHIENQLLNLLDGYNSKNNTLFIFITNKLDKIPSRFTERPSRIRDVIEYNNTPFEVISQILESKIPEKYKGFINIKELSFKFSESGKTIDQAKTEAISLIEDIIIESENSVEKLVKS